MLKNIGKINKILPLFLIVIILILDFMNIGTYIPFMNHLNLQFWNLVIVVVLFAISYHFIDSRNVKRNEAQEKTGKLLIRLACKTCITTSEIMDGTKVKLLLTQDLDGDKALIQNTRYSGLHDLPFSDDQDIKKLAFDGVINSNNFESYIQLKNTYQNMVAMYFTAPDHPEIYQKLKLQMRNIAEELIKNLDA